MGSIIKCRTVQTGWHRHRHRCKWVANPFSWCRGVGQCEHSITCLDCRDDTFEKTVADPRGHPQHMPPPPLRTKIFLISYRTFLGKSGKFVCWQTPTGGLLHPPTRNPGSAPNSAIHKATVRSAAIQNGLWRSFLLAAPPPTDQNGSLISVQFFGKIGGKFVCWRPLLEAVERPLLRGILDPPL